MKQIESDKQQYLIADDILPAVFSYLNWKDIIYTQQVCKQWKEAACCAITPTSSMLPIIFGYFDWKEILYARGTCTQWCEAARHTLVPLSVEKRAVYEGGSNPPKVKNYPQFHVNTSRRYNMLNVMRKVMPNLQRIQLSKFQGSLINNFVHDEISCFQYETSEERYLEEGEESSQDGAYDVSIIADFRNLRSLVLNCAPLYGGYPCFFGFKYLQELSIHQGDDYCEMVWDLKMLTGMSLIEKLTLIESKATGSISDLLFLTNTLRELVIASSPNQRAADCVDGDFMDLAQFTALRKLDLKWAKGIRGDVSNIQLTDFPCMQQLDLPGVLLRVDQSTEIISLFTELARRSPPCIASVRLSENSPDHFERDNNEHRHSPPPPFTLEFVHQGTILGWRWVSYHRWGRIESCEINWLQEDLDTGSDQYHLVYREETNRLVESVGFYEGIYNLPTEEEYRAMCTVHEEIEFQKRLDFAKRIRNRSANRR